METVKEVKFNGNCITAIKLLFSWKLHKSKIEDAVIIKVDKRILYSTIMLQFYSQAQLMLQCPSESAPETFYKKYVFVPIVAFYFLFFGNNNAKG